MTRIRFAVMACVALSAPLLPAPAAAAPSFDSCTGIVTSLPAVITTPGIWCLDEALTSNLASGYAISIDTDNVTLDCNGFRLSNLGAGVATAATGIYAHQRRNVTVRDCDVRGFWTGTKVSATPARVTGSRFEGNLQYGIRMVGDQGVIDGNRVYDTGGSSLAPSAIAIHAVGLIDIQDNTVSGVFANGNATARGIVVQNNVAGTVRGNRLREMTGKVAGIVISTGSLPQELWPLPLGVTQFSSQYSQNTGAILAYTSLAMIPALVFFLLAEKRIVGGLTGAVKG